MQKSIEELNELVRAIPKKEAKNIAIFLENKLGLLKSCYDKSEKHFKVKILELIEFRQLRCFFTGEQFRDSSGSRVIELKDILYSIERIQDHIEDGLPLSRQWKAIAFYSFYFGGYRAFFRCFTKEFLTKSIKLDEAFMKDVFTSTTTYLDKPKDFQDNNKSHKHLNIIPFIDEKESVFRMDIIDDVNTLFLKHKKVNINGLSGIGKTFIAKHFSQHYAVQFTNIVWLNCTEGFPEAFSQEKGIGLLGNLGLANEYSSYLGNEKGLMNLVIGYLSKIEGNNLLILDNLNSGINLYKDEINLLSKNWSILATSQEQLIGFENYAAPDFKKESLELFYTFYTIEKDDDNLIRLLSAIEYHTLAIELLAITAQQRGFSIIALVNRFIKKGINIVEQVEIIVDHGRERKSNIENIEQYLEIIFDTSSIKDEQCKILLNIALMQGDSIPLDLFEEVYLNELYSEDLLDNLRFNIRSLIKKGWVKSENKRIRLHGLIKSIIIKRTSEREDLYKSTSVYLMKLLKKYAYQIRNYLDYLKISEAILKNSIIKKDSIITLEKAVSVCYEVLGLSNSSKLIWFNMPDTDDTNEVILKYHNLAVLSMNQGNFEQAYFYSNQVCSFFSAESWEEDLISVKEKLENFLKNTDNKTTSVFETNKVLNIQVQVVEMGYNCHTIRALYDKKNNIQKKICQLEKAISTLDSILSIYEKNLPETNLFLIDSYIVLIYRKESYFRFIGNYYIELKEFQKAEQYLLSMIYLIETELSDDSVLLSNNYNNLIILYLKCGNLEKAEYYVKKNKSVSKTLHFNHPNNLLFQNILLKLEKAKKERNSKDDSEIAIKEKFEVLFQKNPNSTSLWQYYYTLTCVYFEYDIVDIALEYVIKEIKFLISIGNSDDFLANAFIRSAMCYLQMGNIDEAVINYNKAQSLSDENKLKHKITRERIFTFKEEIIIKAFKFNYLTIISQVLKNEVSQSLYEHLNSISDVNVEIRNSIQFEKLINFLIELPDIKDNINWMNTAENWIESLEKKHELFLEKYNSFLDDIFNKVKDIKTNEILQKNLRYETLNLYYKKMAEIFSRYENWYVAIQYYLRRFFILASDDFGDYRGIENVYLEMSNCFFKLNQFESSLKIIHEGLIQLSELLEDKNNTTEYIDSLKTALKQLLESKDKIEKEVEKFKDNSC